MDSYLLYVVCSHAASLDVLQVLSPASPGDVRVESSLMCLGRKGAGGETL